MAVVRTVLGEVDSSELGPTLFHEHLLLNGETAWRRPATDDAEGWVIADEPVRMEFLGRLRNDPYLSLDNTRLDSVETAVRELGALAAVGGRTLIEVTPDAAGRNPEGLKEIAEATGLNIVMGCGYYLERTHPAGFAEMPIDDIADRIVADIVEGVNGVHAGVIGEIGVGLHFTDAEEHSLRAAARAQRRCGVPLSVHLPGWLRYGHRVLDIVEEEGGVLDATVLCHMNPSHTDEAYQRSLADRGAWVEYDMLGMEFHYPGEGQSPSDEDNAVAIARLLANGYGSRLLLSHDVFIKTLQRTYGGFGYAHVLTGFADRLERHGVQRAQLLEILTANPQAVFDAAWEGRAS
ncbi:MAG: phosphotriesterase-related protein [Coriobacteriia bacterium]|nr:phosphotriesterase-related protein [Coriobacteriia bacterium]MBN2840268.1 phosphotriesterase-related protein [Coriobacteriia bacterium]